ncbi:phosphoglycolate phosphatase [Imbroritus primus]|jgi:2-phosphoglycolate phosphatase|uniref:Phosphoglycolate phosphatase n=1 Tax=Imbroritus primus TaxID=3058603 RepID=A0ACD3SV01_9BURK|nr:phosphoglycolate phosphatase [Burkholderiaceae bacterium PBA]
MHTYDGVFFDLDGTLADTAPDLAAAANRLRVDHGQPPLPLDQLRPVASAGARGLLGVAFGITPEDDGYAVLRDTFLDYYESALAVDTRLFDGIPDVLEALQAAGMPWGIVTNKNSRFTEPLVTQIGLRQHAAAIVSGDTTPHAKPHPAPLLHAAAAAGLDAARCVYIGDDLRDIQAGRAAGMTTIAAAYGYCGDGLPAAMWQADHIVQSARELTALLLGQSA